MFNKSNTNIITMNRGDTVEFSLYLNAGTNMGPKPFDLSAGAKIYFYILFPNEKFENAYLRQTYGKEDIAEDGYNLTVRLSSEDTISMPTGKYYYSVRIVDGEMNYTTIPATLLYII